MTKQRSKPGRTSSLGPPAGEPWIWITTTMLGSITFRGLGIGARRNLDFLLMQHAAKGGRENGNLTATYKQLAVWGSTAADVRRGFEELYATGFVCMTFQGHRQAGGGEPSRYALTWLPTLGFGPTQVKTEGAGPPTHEWTEVISHLNKKGIGTVRGARTWLKGQTSGMKRGARKQQATPHLSVVPPPT
jgi:hypothetical protein